MKRHGLALNNKGFSLIEILIVLALVGGIVAMIANRVSGARDDANVRTTKIIMQEVINKLELYSGDCGSYPTTEQGLDALVKKPAECESWGPTPYSKDIPVDAWKNKFDYQSDGTDFELTSFGRNKRAGGEGVDADISSKKLK